MRTVLSLLAVIGLMAAVVFLMKRFMVGRRRGASAPVEVELLGSRVLQPKRSVHVLRVLDTVFVVGSSEEGLRTLARIGGRETRALLDERAAREEAAAPVRGGVFPAAHGFAAVLRSVIAAAGRPGETAGGKA